MSPLTYMVAHLANGQSLLRILVITSRRILLLQPETGRVDIEVAPSMIRGVYADVRPTGLVRFDVRVPRAGPFERLCTDDAAAAAGGVSPRGELAKSARLTFAAMSTEASHMIASTLASMAAGQAPPKWVNCRANFQIAGRSDSPIAGAFPRATRVLALAQDGIMETAVDVNGKSHVLQCWGFADIVDVRTGGTHADPFTLSFRGGSSLTVDTARHQFDHCLGLVLGRVAVAAAAAATKDSDTPAASAPAAGTTAPLGPEAPTGTAILARTSVSRCSAVRGPQVIGVGASTPTTPMSAAPAPVCEARHGKQQQNLVRVRSVTLDGRDEEDGGEGGVGSAVATRDKNGRDICEDESQDQSTTSEVYSSSGQVVSSSGHSIASDTSDSQEDKEEGEGSVCLVGVQRSGSRGGHTPEHPSDATDTTATSTLQTRMEAAILSAAHGARVVGGAVGCAQRTGTGQDMASAQYAMQNTSRNGRNPKLRSPAGHDQALTEGGSAREVTEGGGPSICVSERGPVEDLPASGSGRTAEAAAAVAAAVAAAAATPTSTAADATPCTECKGAAGEKSVSVSPHDDVSALIVVSLDADVTDVGPRPQRGRPGASGELHPTRVLHLPAQPDGSVGGGEERSTDATSTRSTPLGREGSRRSVSSEALFSAAHSEPLPRGDWGDDSSFSSSPPPPLLATSSTQPGSCRLVSPVQSGRAAGRVVGSAAVRLPSPVSLPRHAVRPAPRRLLPRPTVRPATMHRVPQRTQRTAQLQHHDQHLRRVVGPQSTSTLSAQGGRVDQPAPNRAHAHAGGDGHAERDRSGAGGTGGAGRAVEGDSPLSSPGDGDDDVERRAGVDPFQEATDEESELSVGAVAAGAYHDVRLPRPPSNQMVYASFLYKKGRGQRLLGRRNWKLRWFTLDFDGKIRYYDRSPGASGVGGQGTLKGQVDMADGYRVVDQPDSAKKPHRFKSRDTPPPGSRGRLRIFRPHGWASYSGQLEGVEHSRVLAVSCPSAAIKSAWITRLRKAEVLAPQPADPIALLGTRAAIGGHTNGQWASKRRRPRRTSSP